MAASIMTQPYVVAFMIPVKEVVWAGTPAQAVHLLLQSRIARGALVQGVYPASDYPPEAFDNIPPPKAA